MNIPLNIDWQQILLHLFNFAVLTGGLYLLLYRPVKQFMEQRRAYYETLHQKAEKDREEARQMKEEYARKLAQADETVARRKAQSEQELEQLRVQRTAAARQEAEEILAKARESALREREDILDKTSGELVNAAVTAAKKIALGADGDPYEQFLSLAERRASHGQSR